jgi:hypothetical protein
VLAVEGARSTDDWGDAEVTTVRRTDLAATVIRLLSEGRDRVGLAGTDADVARVAFTAHEVGGRLGLALPALTDLAAMFAQRGDDSARRLEKGSPYHIDLGFITGRWGSRPFVNAIASGMPAGRWGLSPISPIRRGTVQVAGSRQPLEIGGAVGLFVMNGQRCGGMTIAPKATPMDSRFDLQVLSATRHRLPRLRSAIHRGLHLGSPGVTRRRVSAARISVPDGWPVSGDGERLGHGSFTVSMAEGAVEILV